MIDNLTPISGKTKITVVKLAGKNTKQRAIKKFKKELSAELKERKLQDLRHYNLSYEIITVVSSLKNKKINVIIEFILKPRLGRLQHGKKRPAKRK